MMKSELLGYNNFYLRSASLNSVCIIITHKGMASFVDLHLVESTDAMRLYTAVCALLPLCYYVSGVVGSVYGGAKNIQL